MAFRTAPGPAGDTSALPRWRHGRQRRLSSGAASWMAVIAGLLGSYGTESLTLQAAAGVVGVAGIIGVVVTMIAH